MLVVSGENGTGFLNTEFAEGTEKKREKQIPRCARNDNSRSWRRDSGIRGEERVQHDE